MQLAGNEFILVTQKKFLQTDQKRQNIQQKKSTKRYEYIMYQEQIQMTNTLGKNKFTC